MLLVLIQIYTYDVHENSPIFKTPNPPFPATSKILPPPSPWTSNFKRIPPPLQIIANQFKENIIQGWLLYLVRPFLQVGFRFQHQLINLMWLSIDFFSFSWSQSRPQSTLKQLKNSFSPSSYSVKIRQDQGWAKASLSTFSWLYFLVCAGVQKYHKTFFFKKIFF